MPDLAALAFLCASRVAVDGDTLRCRDEGLVRLLAIDAPELPGHCRRGRQCTPGDPFASKANLERLIRRAAVQCSTSGRDRYRRILARCRAGPIDLSCAHIAAGFAVERYSKAHCSRERCDRAIQTD